MPTRLRAVEPGESRLSEPVLSVTRAAAEGTTRQLLVAMRDRVATAVEDPNTAARDLAALTRRLREISKDIEAIDAKESGESDSAEVTDEDFDAQAV